MGPPECQALIVGCGIGSLALAIGLRNAGHKVIIFERRPEFQDVGFGIQVPPNASKVLQHLGVLDAVRASAISSKAITLRSYSNGSVLSTLTLVPDMENIYQVPFLNVHRVDFHTILLAQARAAGVEIKMASTVTKIDFSKPSVELSNSETYNADVVVGGDGDGSTTRQTLLGYSDLPYHSGDKVLTLTFPAYHLRQQDELRDLVEPPTINAWFGPHAHVVAFTLKKHNENDLFNIIVCRPTDVTKPVQQQPQKADMEELRKYSKDWDPRYRRLLDIAEQAVEWTLTETAEPRKWCDPNGRFALMGDAAHAMLPYLAQGAAVGLEDAAALSALFMHLEDKAQIPDLLTIYERLRKPRTYEIKRRSRAMRDVNNIVDGPVQRERDRQLLEHKPFDGYPNPWADPVGQQWMFGYDAFREAEEAWQIYKRGEWPLSRGLWRL
ncbi:MAG: hypothetical protein Q9167_006285 [Letrouitia subvulpina]